MAVRKAVDLKILLVYRQDAALTRVIGEPDERGISQIDVLVSIFSDIAGKCRVASEWNVVDSQSALGNPIQQRSFTSRIEKETGLNDDRGDRPQRLPVPLEVVDRRLMKCVAANVQRDQKAGVNEQLGHGSAPVI